METYCKGLRQQRRRRGLSQQALAEAMGYSNKKNIINWELGYNHPSIKEVVRLSKFFKCTLNQLVYGDKRLEKYERYNKRKERANERKDHNQGYREELQRVESSQRI